MSSETRDFVTLTDEEKELLKAKFRAYAALVSAAEDSIIPKLVELREQAKQGKRAEVSTGEYFSMVADKMIDIVLDLDGGKYMSLIKD